MTLMGETIQLCVTRIIKLKNLNVANLDNKKEIKIFSKFWDLLKFYQNGEKQNIKISQNSLESWNFVKRGGNKILKLISMEIFHHGLHQYTTTIEMSTRRAGWGRAWLPRLRPRFPCHFLPCKIFFWRIHGDRIPARKFSRVNFFLVCFQI